MTRFSPTSLALVEVSAPGGLDLACDHLAAAIARDVAKHPVSPAFPATSVAEVKQANLDAGYFWASREAMRDAGSKFHGELRKSGLFVESIESPVFSLGHDYRVHFMLPSGAVWTCVRLIGSLDEARGVARDLGAAMGAHEGLQAVLSSVTVG